MDDTNDGNEILSRYDVDDKGNPLIVVTNIARNRVRTIDVIRSIELDPSNIGEPLVVMTIVECTDAIEKKRGHRTLFCLDQRTGKEWLGRIFKALLSGADKRGKELKRHGDALDLIVDMDDKYFESLRSALEDQPPLEDGNHPAVKSILVIMNSQYPDEQYREKNLELGGFLNELISPSDDYADDPLGIPRKGGGAALRNLFLRWKYRQEHGTVKDRVSDAKRYMQKFAEAIPPDYPLDPEYGIFTQAELDAYGTACFHRWTGINMIAPAVEDAINNSRLVFNEVPLPKS